MTPVRSIMRLLENYQISQAIMTANGLGVFATLQTGPNDLEGIVRKLRLSKRGAVRLLDTLTNVGLVKYSRTANGKTFFGLTNIGRRAFGKNGNIRSWTEHQRTLFHLWTNLPKSVKEALLS